MTFRGMSYMCKIERKMTQALYLSILQAEVMKAIIWYHFNPSCVILQHDSDPKHTTKLVKQWISMHMLMYLLGLLNHLTSIQLCVCGHL
jgi:hypothetical protein